MTHRPYYDMGEHLERLDERGLLVTVDEPVDKDTELHPLVRWQFRGGLPEEERKAFLFTNVVGARGESYDVPVTVGAMSANREIYSVGMGVDIEDVPDTWERALNDPIEPERVDSADAPVHENVIAGDELTEDGNGLDGLPVPISTPGWDNAPYTTMSAGVSHDPETGVRNYGLYRCQLKSPTRTGVFSNASHGVFQHWETARARGEPLPVAFCVSAPPVVAYTAAQGMSRELDELAVAGALAGGPVREVEARTIPVRVPADADIVIEGEIRPDVVEPEGPFGESHGYMSLQEYNMVFEVSAITCRDDPVYASIISQVTPSESSTISNVAGEALFYSHLTKECNLGAVEDVTLHEPLTNNYRVIVLNMAADADPSEVWRALYATVTVRAGYGRIVIAVDDDIDPDNRDALFWAMCYRSNPIEDVEILGGRNRGHHPNSQWGEVNSSALLWDATRRESFPPISLPKREYMKRARALWERLDLPDIDPQAPWYGYSLGEWTAWEEEQAQRAVEGRYFETGEELKAYRASPEDHPPNTRALRDDVERAGDTGSRAR